MRRIWSCAIRDLECLAELLLVSSRVFQPFVCTALYTKFSESVGRTIPRQRVSPPNLCLELRDQIGVSGRQRH
jgi:hypothetical protein